MRDRIGDAEVLDGLADVATSLLEGELRRVHADHHQALILVLLGPGLDVGQRAQAVDAGVGPEVDQHDLALAGSAVSGGELSQAIAPASDGTCPTGSAAGAAGGLHRRGGRSSRRPSSWPVIAGHHGVRRHRGPPSCVGAGCIAALARAQLVEQGLLERRRCWPSRLASGSRCRGPKAMRHDRRQHRARRGRGGSIRRRPASASWPRTPVPPTSSASGQRGRRAQRHRPAAAARSARWRPAAPRRSGSGPGSARRRAPTAGPWRRRAAATAPTDAAAPAAAVGADSRQPRAQRHQRPGQRGRPAPGTAA